MLTSLYKALLNGMRHKALLTDESFLRNKNQIIEQYLMQISNAKFKWNPLTSIFACVLGDGCPDIWMSVWMEGYIKMCLYAYVCVHIYIYIYIYIYTHIHTRTILCIHTVPHWFRFLSSFNESNCKLLTTGHTEFEREVLFYIKCDSTVDMDCQRILISITSTFKHLWLDMYRPNWIIRHCIIYYLCSITEINMLL